MAVPPSPSAPPRRPPNLASGRWLDDLSPLNPAEMALVNACKRGEPWVPAGWDGERPTEATTANTIRADVIRFLLLGGDTGHPVHEEGVMLDGAWITGTLNLHQARCAVRLDARSCYFEDRPDLMAAHLPQLVLSGSRVPGLDADRLTTTGTVFLDEKFEAEGEVRLLGAEIGGNLDCSGGSFDGASGDALCADGLRLTGALFLRETSISGAINLATARIGTLADGDLTMWQSGDHVLDGFRYDRIVGVTDADRRIAWLRQQDGTHLTSDFRPQPWEQLIKVLRDMGHPYDAGEVAIAKQEQLRAAGKIQGPVRQALHGLYGAFTGYGYRPLRLIYSAGVIWFVASLLYAHAAAIGIMAPSNAEIIAHRQLHTDLRGAVADSGACGVRGEVQPGNFWPQCPGLPSEYTTFHSFAYSLDLILPLVDLQQEHDWAPAVSYTDARGTVRNSVAGQLIRAVLWFEILFGWTASLVLVAVLTRLVEKD